MRLSNYLTETTLKNSEIIAIIKKDCKPFLKMMHDSKSLYFRGTHDSPTISRFQRIENRNPLDTVKIFHDMLNNYFIKYFGWPVRNGVFATATKNNALMYGAIHIIFGKGNFKYCWCPGIHDMVFDRNRDLLLNDFVKTYIDKNIENVRDEEISFNFPNGYYAIKSTDGIAELYIKEFL
jgi:hypothetical protein